MKILVAEPLSPAGIELLQSQTGWSTVVSNPKEYAQHLADADALVVRSAVQVNADVLAKAPKLRVVGRAGVGVDNVDLDAATAAGVLVMNTPGGNAASVAEHALAADARHGAPHSAGQRLHALRQMGEEEISGQRTARQNSRRVGLGSIGREVVKRARAFEMRIVANDPYVTSQIAQDLGVELVSLDDLYAASDYITLHVSLTPETEHMLNARRLRQNEARRAHRESARAASWWTMPPCATPSNPARSPAPLWTCSQPSRRPLASRCSRSTPSSPRRTSAARPKKRRKSSACASPNSSSSI